MLDMEYAPIKISRLDQLHKAEQDANLMKAFIAKKYENYGTVCRAELELLYTMFIGEKEED